MKVVDVVLLFSLTLTYPILMMDYYVRGLVREIGIKEIFTD
jgi:hypothetical protein